MVSALQGDVGRALPVAVPGSLVGPVPEKQGNDFRIAAGRRPDQRRAAVTVFEGDEFRRLAGLVAGDAPAVRRAGEETFACPPSRALSG